MYNFSDLGLKNELLSAVADLGFTQPTPIQQQAIPALLENPSDLVGLARTGTGKTAAFGLPVLHYVQLEDKHPQAIILCPTRELCVQISEDMRQFAKYMRGINILPVYGGASIGVQIKELKRGAQVIVGTPGRVNDMIERGALDLRRIRYVVLDEADEMLNMGFRDAIDTILAETPKERATWLFSATMPEGVARIARNYMTNPITVSVKGAQQGDGEISHCYTLVSARDRYAALRRFIDADPNMYAIVFCRTKAETQEVADYLGRDGYSSDALHGDLSQAQRDYVMKRFRNKVVRILVATDVAARGIDVDEVTHVFHYQIPDEPESYTHRSGRTGRAGKSGISIIIAGARDNGRIRNLERATNKKLVYLPVPSGDDILKNQIVAFASKIREANDLHINPKHMDLLQEALNDIDAAEALNRLVAMSLQRIIKTSENTYDLNLQPGKPEKREKRASGDELLFFVGLGRMDNIEPSMLLRVFCDTLNTNREHIGRIDLKHNFSFVSTIGLTQRQVEDAFRDFEYMGRRVPVKISDNPNGGSGGRGGRKRYDDEGPRSSGGFKKDFGKRSDSSSRGGKSFGRDSRSENVGKGFGKPRKEERFSDSPKGKSATGGKKKFGESPFKNEDSGDWRNLMQEGGGSRKDKFKKR